MKCKNCGHNKIKHDFAVPEGDRKMIGFCIANDGKCKCKEFVPSETHRKVK